MGNKVKLSEVLSKDDLAYLRGKSNFRAASMLLLNWAMVIFSFCLFIVAFFENEKTNDFVGHWLCGSVLNISVFAYREYHLLHHRHAGTDKDPDIIFVDKYPVEAASLKRKIIRDISGQTGFRDTRIKLSKFTWAENHPWAVSHLLMILVLSLAGAPWAYALWWVSEIFVLPLLVRIRQIGEHGVADDRSDRSPRLNTGTTLVSWWERLILAPNFVNYHVEHHQFASVPCYHLPELHQKLKQGGYFEGYDCIANGYVDVLRRAVQPAH